MKISSPYHDLELPQHIWFQPSHRHGLPHTIVSTNSDHFAGSGVGFGIDALDTSVGEFLERHHFYRDIKQSSTARLNAALHDREANDFIEALTQTCEGKYSRQLIEKHAFNMAPAFRMNDLTPCQIPRACVTLDYGHDGIDDDIYPNRDTCGCSFHLSAEKSLFGALKECVERQLLLKCWLTNTCNKTLDASEILNTLSAHRARQLFNYYTSRGKLKVLDISDPHFPGTCILVLYGNPTDTDPVKYCAGMGFAESLSSSLEKALVELWQTFRFMSNFIGSGRTSDQITDGYLKYFISCNTFSTYLTWTHTKSTKHVTVSHKTFCLSELIESLDRAGINGYFYISTRNHLSHNYVFSKFISPCFFLHMNNAHGCNLDNHFSRNFRKDIHSDRLKTMVPFP